MKNKLQIEPQLKLTLRFRVSGSPQSCIPDRRLTIVDRYASLTSACLSSVSRFSIAQVFRQLGLNYIQNPILAWKHHKSDHSEALLAGWCETLSSQSRPMSRFTVRGAADASLVGPHALTFTSSTFIVQYSGIYRPWTDCILDQLGARQVILLP